MKKGLLSNEKYISWSQIEKIEQRPRQYINTYIKGEIPFYTKNMQSGIKVHQKIEDGTLVVPEVGDTKREFEFKVDYKEGIKLVGRMDGLNEEELILVENKTSVGTWTQEDVDNHGQLQFYFLAYFLKTGLKLKKAILNFIQMEYDKSGKVKETGKVFSFVKNFTDEDLEKIKNRIDAAVAKIVYLDEHYDKPDNLLMSYIEIKRQKDDLEERIEEIKEKMKLRLLHGKQDKSVSPFATISIRRFKKYKYRQQDEEALKELKMQMQEDAEMTYEDRVVVTLI